MSRYCPRPLDLAEVPIQAFIPSLAFLAARELADKVDRDFLFPNADIPSNYREIAYSCRTAKEASGRLFRFETRFV